MEMKRYHADSPASTPSLLALAILGFRLPLLFDLLQYLVCHTLWILEFLWHLH